MGVDGRGERGGEQAEGGASLRALEGRRLHRWRLAAGGRARRGEAMVLA